MSGMITTETAGYRRSASPNDALGSTARYLVNRGKYHRGEHWVMKSARPAHRRAAAGPMRRGQGAGVSRADGQAFSQPNASAQMWVPVQGARPFCSAEFLRRAQLQSLDELCAGDCHLGDRILGAPPFIQPFPGSERALTLAKCRKCRPA